MWISMYLNFYLVLKAVNKGEEYHLKGRWTGEQLREQKMGLIDLSDEKGAEKNCFNGGSD